jgi:TonB family protein
MGQRDRKILRIGVIQNGKIVEERLLRKREAVTIGQSPRNTFVLPAASVPKSYTLFDLRSGTFQLNFRDDMDGRVSVEDAVLDLKSVRERKLAAKKGDGYALTLSEKSRGKVVLGDVTLLFQFVVPPPPSRLQLPASVKQTWFKRFDWTFTSYVLASFIAQVFTIAWGLARDYPPPPKGIDNGPDRFVEVIVSKRDQAPVQKEQPVEDTAKKSDGGEATAEARPAPRAQPKQQEQPKGDSKDDLKRMQKKVVDNSILKYAGMTASGDGPNIVDQLRDAETSAAIANAFDGTSDVNAGVATGSGRPGRGVVENAGTGTVAGIGDKDLVAAKGGQKVDTGAKAPEVAVKGNVAIQKPSEAFGTGSLDQNEIAQQVNRRKGAITACYEKQLKKNPKLAGKVKVQFTILESGRVDEARVIEDSTGDRAVGQCIADNIKRWRFPKPDGGSVTVAYPFLFTPAG